MSTFNLTTWNISMDQEFHDRFNAFRLKFKVKNRKGTDKALTKAEFGRFLFEQWEARYNELNENNVEITRIEEEISALEQQASELQNEIIKITPQKAS